MRLGWRGGFGEALADAGDVEEGAGGAVGGWGVAVVDVLFEGVEGVGEESADAVGVVVEDGLAGALEGGAEGGVLGLPAKEGAAIHVEFGGDRGVGFAGEHEVEGGELERGEIGERVAGRWSGGLGRNAC